MAPNNELAATLLAACVQAVEQIGKDRIKEISWFGRNHRVTAAKAA